MALHVTAIDEGHSAALRRGQVHPVIAVVGLILAIVAVGGVGAAALDAAGDGVPQTSGWHSGGGSLVT